MIKELNRHKPKKTDFPPLVCANHHLGYAVAEYVRWSPVSFLFSPSYTIKEFLILSRARSHPERISQPPLQLGCGHVPK